MRRSVIAGFAVLTLSSLAGVLARADGILADAIGATSGGRGGTNLGAADTGAILHDNPAGMVNVDGNGLFEVGADLLFPDISYADPENDTRSAIHINPAPNVSFIKKSADEIWAVGLGVYTPGGFSTDFDLVHPRFGVQEYSSFSAFAKVLPGIACRVFDRLSIGGTFGVAINQVELESPFNFQTGPFAGAATYVDVQATGVAPAWSLGAQYELSDRTRLGFAYLGQTRFQLDGEAHLDIFDVAPFVVESSFNTEVDFVWPQSAGVGIQHELVEGRRLLVDAIWYDWSHAMDRIDFRFEAPTNPLVGAVAGPVIRDSLAANWDDTVSIRTGLEQDLSRGRTIRGGYVYHTSPAPSETLIPLIPATYEHVFTVGCSRPLGDWRLSLGYAYSFGPERNVGASDIVGGDFAASRSRAELHVLAVSVLKEF